MILHLVANALLLGLSYYWLGIGESSILHLLWGVLVALIIISTVLVVHLKATGRTLGPLLLLTLVVIAIYALLAAVPEYGFPIASWMTLKTRKPIKPETIQSIQNAVFLVVRWVFIPWIVIPLATAIAADGLKGIKLLAWRKDKLYWLIVPLLLLMAFALPIRLITWGPPLKNFWPQVLSFGGRALIAYLIFTTSLWTLGRVTTRPSAQSSGPTATQPVRERS